MDNTGIIKFINLQNKEELIFNIYNYIDNQEITFKSAELERWFNLKDKYIYFFVRPEPLGLGYRLLILKGDSFKNSKCFSTECFIYYIEYNKEIIYSENKEDMFCIKYDIKSDGHKEKYWLIEWMK